MNVFSILKIDKFYYSKLIKILKIHGAVYFLKKLVVTINPKYNKKN